jgi:hypothetical protein
MTTKQHYEKMFVAVPESAMDDPNHETAIDDMNGYIERMGGVTHTPATCGEVGAIIDYSWTVPAHWTGRLYERFLSFGLKARVRPDSLWFGVLDLDECTSTDPSNHQGDTCPVHEK